MADIISVNNFSKSFGETKVVDDLSFAVKAGEIFAFLGANGSGKTTTIRTLLGIYKPTSGSLYINGQVYTPAMTGLLGYLPEERGLYTDSRAGEILVYFGRLKGMSKMAATLKAKRYLERVGLADQALLPIKKLSSGQQQKIQLGLATLHDPKLLILDEPTKGLDPINRTLLLDILEQLHRQGSTIVFITHQLEEIERLKTDRVLIIRGGKLAALGSPHELKQTYQAKTLDEVFLKVYEVEK